MVAKLKSFIKFWIPAGLLEIVRRNRAKSKGDNPSEIGYLPNVPLLLENRKIETICTNSEMISLEFPLKELVRESEMVLPLAELIAISAICKFLEPKRIFEIGTYKGSTTKLLSINSPPSTEIFTLDLSDAEIRKMGFPFYVAGEYCKEQGHKIKQLYGDSRFFDYSPFYNSIDLIFIDANHTYDFVRSDSAQAFKVLSERGVIIWDDYAWTEKHPECSGVAKFLNEIRFEKNCAQIEGTRLAIYSNFQ